MNFFCFINYNANIVTTMFIDLYVFNVLYWRKTKKKKSWSHNKWKMFKVYVVERLVLMVYVVEEQFC